MKKLKNWDNKTWLSSKSYISKFNKFLKKKINLNKNSKILDIGCGRANIISALQKKYKFRQRPIGLDIIKHKDTKKNIFFKKQDAIKYLKRSNLFFDLILIKQTIHFFKKKDIDKLLLLCMNHLSPNGIIIVLTLKIDNNQIPCFKAMKTNLNKSLKQDKVIINKIKKIFKKFIIKKFNFKVNISKTLYLKMIKKRFISCLLRLSEKEIQKGLVEIRSKYKSKIKFNDVLEGIIYKN